MSWIECIEPEQAEGELRRLYDAIGSARGGVARVHQVQSLNPRAMKAHLELYKSVVFARSSLSRRARERIGVVVSAANGCRYCVGHHGEALRQIGEDPAICDALEAGRIPDTLDERDRRLLEWAWRTTRDATAGTEDDVRELRELGLDDRAILDATLTIGYFNFVNRLVLLLGVDLEEGFERYCSDMPRSDVDSQA